MTRVTAWGAFFVMVPCLTVFVDAETAMAQYPPAAVARYGGPMYPAYMPAGVGVYWPGYAYLPRRAYRTPYLVLPPTTAYRLEAIGPPGIAPSWSTLRAGLDRYPLMGGFEQSPAAASGLEPTPDAIASPPPVDGQASSPVPFLVPPMVNPPAVEYVVPEMIPSPPPESGLQEF